MNSSQESETFVPEVHVLWWDLIKHWNLKRTLTLGNRTCFLKTFQPFVKLDALQRNFLGIFSIKILILLELFRTSQLLSLLLFFSVIFHNCYSPLIFGSHQQVLILGWLEVIGLFLKSLLPPQFRERLLLFGFWWMRWWRCRSHLQLEWSKSTSTRRISRVFPQKHAKENNLQNDLIIERKVKEWHKLIFN